ncbi:hypothetical protein CMO88_05065 [Candidatus Woesearchaeota archaeon]|nr:hypothetical protein [Candidatus Woesearchaeota archaeon]|tara:strand:- start:38 stop:574 length:537 start_codon:yes stop_codon:yes gene_type:complete
MPILSPRFTESYLGEFVYGAIDGAITTFAIVAGAAGANLSSSIVLILGFANLFADGFSMAASNYLSTKTKLEILSKKGHEHPEVRPTKTAVVTFGSFFAIGFIPLISYVAGLFFPAIKDNQFEIAIVLTGLAFFTVGSIKAKVAKKSLVSSTTETLLLGGAAATIAYFVGAFLRSIVG